MCEKTLNCSFLSYGYSRETENVSHGKKCSQRWNNDWNKNNKTRCGLQTRTKDFATFNFLIRRQFTLLHFSASCWWKRDHYYTVNKRIVTLAQVMINKSTLIQCSRGNYSHIFIQKWIDWARVKLSIFCYTLTGQDNDSLSASCRLVSPRESPSLKMSPRESSFLVPLSAEPGESPFHSGLYARGMNIVWM